MFRLFRRQQQEKFLPGLEKIGLRHLPDAVACAQYHYISNLVGDVNVRYVYESDKKAWVTYPPPRWIWEGTAICAIPSEVSRAMMRGWHSHNGVSLENPRLGFVCTKQTVDGQPGLEGYFMEYDRDLAPDERLRFAPAEEPPEFDPEQAPALESKTWPEERLRKVLRNYTMEYVRNILPEIDTLFGPEEGAHLGHTVGKLIGMHYYHETAATLGIEGTGALPFAQYLCRMAQAQGDEAEYDGADADATVWVHSWRLMRGRENLSPSIFQAWNGLWEGCLLAHNPRLRLTTDASEHGADTPYTWRIHI